MPMAPVRNGQVFFEESGAGELIILLPGLGHDHTYYSETVQSLSRLGRGVALDPRGLGRSTESKDGYSVEGWAEDVALLIGHVHQEAGGDRRTHRRVSAQSHRVTGGAGQRRGRLFNLRGRAYR